MRTYSKNKLKKGKEWGGSSGRRLSFQVQTPELQKKKKKYSM
jgi:hypothetical protein